MLKTFKEAFIMQNFMPLSFSTAEKSVTVQTNKQNDKHIVNLECQTQRDGRPAYYRWRPLFNAAVWLTPTTSVPCSNTAKTRNPLKFARVPQTRQQISAVSRRSSPYYEDMWRRYRCLTSFFSDCRYMP